uniref:Uncharacterized protein n=1 Tax=Arundo donax TaxID=35708 RepID=A0A0A9AL14_ARUDO
MASWAGPLHVLTELCFKVDAAHFSS